MSNWASAEAVGRSQFGLITRAQAVAAGLAASSVYRAVEQRRLVTVHSGIYRFAAVAESWEQRALVPQLARPGTSALSHFTAGWLHRLRGVRRPSRLEVSVERGDTRFAPDGFDVHRVERVSAPFRIGAFMVTPIARTIVDLASVMLGDSFTFAFDSATARYPREVQALFEYVSTRDFRGREGMTRVRKLFAQRHGVMLDSELESRVWTALVRSRLPVPMAQHPLGEVMRADFVWSDERVILHVDSRAFHSSRAELERDARQRNQLAADWVSFVVTHETVERGEWLGQVRDALRKRARQRSLSL